MTNSILLEAKEVYLNSQTINKLLLYAFKRKEIGHLRCRQPIHHSHPLLVPPLLPSAVDEIKRYLE